VSPKGRALGRFVVVVGRTPGGKRMDVLGFLARREREPGNAPSMREVCDAVGLRSTQTVHHHLGRLEADGYIRRLGDRSRTRVLTEKGWRALGTAPLLGRISAGRGTEAIADEEAYPLAAELLAPRSGKRRFLLRASGESMLGAGIEDGDLLVFEEEEDAADGEVVAALVNGDSDATVKRLFREGGRVRLKAENEAYEDIVVSAGEVRLQGRLEWIVHRARRGGSR